VVAVMKALMAPAMNGLPARLRVNYVPPSYLAGLAILVRNQRLYEHLTCHLTVRHQWKQRSSNGYSYFQLPNAPI